MKKPLLVITGPTATGKTDLAVQVALKLHGEIVSADSMLVYQGMNIGTAKPDIEARQGIPHHLIDIIAPGEAYNVAQYQQDAETVIANIHNSNKLPILVGGTGLYIRAVIDKYNFNVPGEDRELRRLLQNKVQEQGHEWLHQQLNAVDPVAAAKIHPHNVRRVIRAIEVYQLTGKRFSDVQQASYQNNAKYHLSLFGLDLPREILYRRIELRVDKMLQMGLVEEVQGLMQVGINRQATAMQGLGYKEIAAYLDGEISLAQAVELLKRNTRRYAKRQFTWFKRDPRICWLETNNVEINSQKIIKLWQENIATVLK